MELQHQMNIRQQTWKMNSQQIPVNSQAPINPQMQENNSQNQKQINDNSQVQFNNSQLQMPINNSQI